MSERETKSSGLGKWIAGIASTVIGAVLIWWLTHPGGGFLNPPTPTLPPPSPTPAPPHAPPIENTFGVPLFDEHQQLITIEPGGKIQFTVWKDLWKGPEGASVGCADGFIALTWIVRDPYPTGGEDFQITDVIPQGGGRTEVVGSGMQGSVRLGYCDEITLYNNSLQKYWVELRYASGGDYLK